MGYGEVVGRLSYQSKCGVMTVIAMTGHMNMMFEHPQVLIDASDPRLFYTLYICSVNVSNLQL